MAGSTSSSFCSPCWLGTYGTASAASSKSACVSCWESGDQCYPDDALKKGRCGRCNRLRLRFAEGLSGEYAASAATNVPESPILLCKFGNGLGFVEQNCTAPLLTGGAKNNCEFESNLVCKAMTARQLSSRSYVPLQCSLKSGR